VREVPLPNLGWLPRPHQLNLWRALKDPDRKKFFIFWPRRHGKDEVALHATAVQILRRPGTYFHMLPQATQARKAIWEAVNEETGRRRIFEAFPKAMIAENGVRENEMAIRFTNNATWQVVGSDNYESLIGTSPVGLVYSEWALSRGESYQYLSPIIERNGGRVLFIGTPRGPANHATEMYHKYKDNPEWFCEHLSAENASVFQPEQLKQIKSDLVAMWGEDHGTAIYEQEYLCSLTSSVLYGSYFGKEVERLFQDNHITNVPVDPNLKCYTSWDIGMNNAMVCLIWQVRANAFYLIDMIVHTDVGLDYFAHELDRRAREGRFCFQEHLFPHDMANREVGAQGNSRIDSAYSLGIRPARTIPRVPAKADAINAVRSILPRCYIDKTKCAKMVEALQKYHRKWSSERKCFSEIPEHDWTSDYIDAFATFACSNPDATLSQDRRPFKRHSRGIV
jgi:hypothetical protein